MRFKGLLLAAILGAATPSFAQNSATLERYGNWTSFVARTPENRIICGIDVYDERDGRHFMMKWIQGNNRITFQIVDPRWRLPVGSPIEVAMRIDNYNRWNAPSVANSPNVIEWYIQLSHISNFESQFRAGNMMYISFPGTSERTWTISLTGSNAIVGSLVECMRSARNIN